MHGKEAEIKLSGQTRIRGDGLWGLCFVPKLIGVCGPFQRARSSLPAKLLTNANGDTVESWLIVILAHNFFLGPGDSSFKYLFASEF